MGRIAGRNWSVQTNPAAGKANPEIQAIFGHFEVGIVQEVMNNNVVVTISKWAMLSVWQGVMEIVRMLDLSLWVGSTVCHRMVRNHTSFISHSWK